MDIRFTEPSRVFRTTNGGAGLSFEHPCNHGSPALSFHLFSEHDGITEDIAILLPACAAPHLFGAALAYLEAAQGSGVGQQFIEDMLAARDRSAQLLAAKRAEYEAASAACCEAGYRTQGREHTCRGTQPST
ncbi:hypothetical protein [Streptomyces kebangsaanensis]|uniref:hypothetical protein n=1 Tax=Streptomyces kebangsaanensis TaxID=864058 RepID=UPI000939B279|nr:hypothetical protein [Streptomyces kebangsaanensis]